MEILKFISKCDEYFAEHEEAEHRTSKGYEKIYSLARQNISDPKTVLRACTYLRQKMVIMRHQQKLNHEQYFPVLDAIRDAARQDLAQEAPVRPETDWNELLKIIIKNRKELCFFDGPASSPLDERLATFAYSYQRLTSFGVEIIEDDYRFYISEQSYRLIQSEIERLCAVYGGDNMLLALTQRLGKTFNSITGRFMEYRRVSMGTTSVQAALPFGYLFALGVKHAGSKGFNNSSHFEHLLMLISDLIVIFEIQPYSQFEALHLGEDAMLDFVKKNILYDSLVGLPQIKASCAFDLVNLMHEKFSIANYYSHRVKIKDVTRVALALISLSDTKRFTTVTAKQITSKTGIAEFKVKDVVERVLSAASGSTNSELAFPPSSLAIDHYFKPIIKVGNQYRIFPKSIASLGALNAVCKCISSPDGEWSNPKDSALGYAIEDFLREKLMRKGISIIHGVRIGGGVKLESDLICETNDKIYIFEMKKKGLTRQALSGDETKILSDLADSLLATHVQAMRIENVLKNNGSISLANNGDVKTIYLNGRDVTRVSVSLHDFGALQDKTVFQRILTIAVFSEVKHSDKKADEILNKWRKHSAELKRLAGENGELGVKGRMPFHNTLFMSIPQIIMVLENSDTPSDFFKHMTSLVSMTTGSRDTYTEFLNRLHFVAQCKAEGLDI